MDPGNWAGSRDEEEGLRLSHYCEALGPDHTSILRGLATLSEDILERPGIISDGTGRILLSVTWTLEINFTHLG